MEITALQLAKRFVGIKEVAGQVDNPQILAMLKLDNDWPQNDEVPWCSAFVGYICWLLDLPRSKSLLARSWLDVGIDVPLENALPGFDICIFKRGNSPITGHVGFYIGSNEKHILILGGNQSNQVKISEYSVDQLLGVRRLV